MTQAAAIRSKQQEPWRAGPPSNMGDGTPTGPFLPNSPPPPPPPKGFDWHF